MNRHKDYSNFAEVLSHLGSGAAVLNTTMTPAGLIDRIGSLYSHVHGQTVNKLRRENLIKGKANAMTLSAAGKKRAATLSSNVAA